VIGSIVDIVLSSNGGSSGLQALRVLRILRVVRALRLVRRNPRLKLILNTMAASVYTISSIIAFMALYVFLFGLFRILHCPAQLSLSYCLKCSFMSCLCLLLISLVPSPLLSLVLPPSSPLMTLAQALPLDQVEGLRL
jgi:hypothetical protein